MNPELESVVDALAAAIDRVSKKGSLPRDRNWRMLWKNFSLLYGKSAQPLVHGIPIAEAGGRN